MSRRARSLLVLLAAAWLSLAPSAARQPTPGEPDAPPPAELRQAMSEFFADRLRAELALSDEQAAQVLPPLERFERERHELRREQGETLRRLREGLDGGASDAELAPLVLALDRHESARVELRREALAEADRSLTVRQQIRLRLFLERFPRLVHDKIREIRGEDPRLERRPRPPRGRPEGS